MSAGTEARASSEKDAFGMEWEQAEAEKDQAEWEQPEAEHEAAADGAEGEVEEAAEAAMPAAKAMQLAELAFQLLSAPSDAGAYAQMLQACNGDASLACSILGLAAEVGCGGGVREGGGGLRQPYMLCMLPDWPASPSHLLAPRLRHPCMYAWSVMCAYMCVLAQEAAAVPDAPEPATAHGPAADGNETQATGQGELSTYLSDALACGLGLQVCMRLSLTPCQGCSDSHLLAAPLASIAALVPNIV